MNKRLKILIGVLVVLALVLAYVLISPNLSIKNEVIISQENVSAAQEVLGVLSFLNGISLNTDFLNNAEFKSLYSFVVELPVPITGKTNPFMP